MPHSNISHRRLAFVAVPMRRKDQIEQKGNGEENEKKYL